MTGHEVVPRTGVVGLGDIGRGVAGTLQRAGVDLVVCDVRADATEPFRDTSTVAGTPGDLAHLCDIAVVAVVDDAQVRSVVLGDGGIATSGGSCRAVVILSTVSTETVTEVAGQAAEQGVLVVDCGVSGGPAAAADGQLVCMVGGTEEAVDRVRPVLAVIGSDVLHMGPLGAGLSAKLARNIVQYGSWLAAYEAQVLAEAAGISLPLLARAIRESDQRIGGASTLMFRDTAQPLRPDLKSDAGLIPPMTAASRLAHKDLRAALELGGALGVPLPLARLTDELCDQVFGVAATTPGTGSEEGSR